MKLRLVSSIVIIFFFSLLGGFKIVDTKTPTLFFHGGGSSYKAEESMVNAAKKAGVTRTIIRANVDKEGNVTFIGKMKKGSKNPIVEVNYERNLETNFNIHGKWATAVVKKLQTEYGIKKINMVGHSLGNISIIYYMLENSENKSMPQLQKQVDIAGHFAGLDFKNLPSDITKPKNMKIDPNGKPNKMNATYRQMTKLRNIYPKNQVDVLNIVGDIGDKTDGTVDNNSSLSLKYLLSNRAKSYQTLFIKGKEGQHSRLHENTEVDRKLIDFIWSK